MQVKFSTISIVSQVIYGHNSYWNFQWETGQLFEDIPLQNSYEFEKARISRDSPNRGLVYFRNNNSIQLKIMIKIELPEQSDLFKERFSNASFDRNKWNELQSGTRLLVTQIIIRDEIRNDFDVTTFGKEYWMIKGEGNNFTIINR